MAHEIASLDFTSAKITKHINVLQSCIREASHIDFVHEKRHMDVLLETPPHSPLETSRTFFDSAENREGRARLGNEHINIIKSRIWGRARLDNEHTNILEM